MFNPLSRWFKARPRARRSESPAARENRVRPTLEQLEDRLTPSTTTYNVVSNLDSSAGASLVMTSAGVFNAPSLRAAIEASNAATTTSNIINLTVAGTYQITIPSSATDNSGGEFAITTNSVTINNTSGSAVIIDGGGGNSRVFDIAPDGDFDTIDVVIGNLADPSITIEHGNGDGGNGGAIRVGAGRLGNGSTLELNNVIVAHNSTSADGGAISLSGPGSVTLNGCTVSDNDALGGGDGGGIAADSAGHDGAININNSTITGNVATGFGGGIDVETGRFGTTTVMVANSTLSNNSADFSGGGIVATDVTSDITVSDSLIFGNKAVTGNGGGIQTSTGLSINDSEITNNLAGNVGGGIDIFGGVLTVLRTTIDGNTASGDGGGLEYESATASTLTNVTFVGNVTSAGGGAIDASSGALSLIQDTITGNTAGGFGVGGVLAEHSAAIILGNTVIAGNLNGANATTTNGTDVGAVTSGRFTSLGGNFIGDTSPVTITPVLNDHFYTGNGPDPGLLPVAANGGTLIGDPRAAVVIPTISDIGGTQPLVDTGDPDASVTTDERGFTRPDTTISGSEGSLPDIGAFEAQDTTLSVVVTASKPTSTVNGTETFTVTVTNTGATALPLDNSVLTFTLPTNVTVTSHPGLTGGGNTLTAVLTALANGAGVTFTVTTTSNTDAAGLSANASVVSPDAGTAMGSAGFNIVGTRAFLVAEFPGQGVWRYDSSTGLWQLLTQADATLVAVDANGDVVGEFSVAKYGTSGGVWRYEDATGWVQLTDIAHNPNAQASLLGMDAAGDVFADIKGYGLDRFVSGTIWTSIQPTGVPTTVDATLLAVGGNGDLAAEFPGAGVWRYLTPNPATDWARLTLSTQGDGGNASLLAMDNHGDVFADFKGYGLDQFVSGTNWTSIQPVGVPTTVDATLLAADGNGDLAAEFPGDGVWHYQAGNPPTDWQQLTLPTQGDGGNAQALAVDVNDDVFADFMHYGVDQFVSDTTWTSVQPPSIPTTVDATLLAADPM